jgi:hypothetical protein
VGAPMNLHFQGEPDRFSRMRELWNMPLAQTQTVGRAVNAKLIGAYLVAIVAAPIVAALVLAVLPFAWVWAWMEER